jgi:hypothetical protein
MDFEIIKDKLSGGVSELVDEESGESNFRFFVNEFTNTTHKQ